MFSGLDGGPVATKHKYRRNVFVHASAKFSLTTTLKPCVSSHNCGACTIV